MFRTQTELFSLDSMDLLWLGRMCVGERRPKILYSEAEISAMLWAMVNRYLLHPGRKHWLTFTYMLRRFSQPINPRWQAGGDLAIKNAGKPNCSPAKLRRRRKICALPWSKIPMRIREDLGRFADGTLLPPECVLNLANNRISNWASYKSVEDLYPGGIWIAGNYFFEDKHLKADVVLPDMW